jgi:hypothetical protein
VESKRKLANSLLTIGCVAVLVGLYCYGAVEHLRKRNLDMTSTDQRAYMRYAINVHSLTHENEYFYGDGVRMPLYPLLQSLVYHPDLTREQHFARGKYFNVGLSLAILVAVHLILREHLPRLYAATLTLVTAFTVFIFKAAYFHAALLFYFFNFCAYLLMCRTLINPTWKSSILTGLVIGLAHLTKAAMLPALGLLVVFSLAQIGYLLYARWKDGIELPKPLKRENRPVFRLLCVALVVLSFLGIVYRFIVETKAVFGRYFYNAATTFYMWYDSWREAKRGTRAHGDRYGWPEMPPEEIPSARKYLREHTTQQIVLRIVNGLKKTHSACRASYGYYKYVLIYSIFFVALMGLNPRHNLGLAAKHGLALLFCLSYFAVYLLGYAWYSPIASGNRFVLAQFLPFMFSISYSISQQPLRHISIPSTTVRLRPSDLMQVAILMVLAFELYFILTARIVMMYGGS